MPKTTTAAGAWIYSWMVASVTFPISSSMLVLRWRAAGRDRSGERPLRLLVQLLERRENVLVVASHFDLLHFHIGHLAILVHDDGGALAAVQRLKIESVLLLAQGLGRFTRTQADAPRRF